jgi:MFS family permease
VPATGPEAVRWPVAIIAVAAISLGSLTPFLTGALAVQLDADLGLTLSQIGGIVAIFFGTSALASAAVGRIVQRRGWRNGIRSATVGAALALGGIAAFAEDWWSLAGFSVLGGLAAAVATPAANLALARSVPPGRYGLMFGLKHAAVPSAVILSGFAVPAVALTVGWRWAYGGAAIMALVAAAAVPGDAEPAPMRISGTRRTPGTTTPLPTLVALAAAAALGIGSLDSLSDFVVRYAVDIGVTESAAGILLSVGAGAGLASRLGLGWAIDRRQHAGLSWISALLFGGSISLMMLHGDARGWLVAGTLLAFATGWGWSGLMTFTVVRANRGSAAVATGITHTGTFVGAALGPLLFGFLAEHVSFETAWWTATGALAVAGTIVTVARLTPSGRAIAADPPEGST